MNKKNEDATNALNKKLSNNDYATPHEQLQETLKKLSMSQLEDLLDDVWSAILHKANRIVATGLNDNTPSLQKLEEIRTGVKVRLS